MGKTDKTPLRWEEVRPGDYIEAAGNVGAVEINPDGSRSITVYPAELRKHKPRPADQPIERRPVPPWVHPSGHIISCPYWFTIATANTSSVFTIYSTVTTA